MQWFFYLSDDSLPLVFGEMTYLRALIFSYGNKRKGIPCERRSQKVDSIIQRKLANCPYSACKGTESRSHCKMNTSQLLVAFRTKLLLMYLWLLIGKVFRLVRSVYLASCVFQPGFLFSTLKIHVDVMENTKNLSPSPKSLFLSICEKKNFFRIQCSWVNSLHY